MNKLRKKYLLTARGPLQFIAGLNAMEWHVKQVQGTLEFDYYLLLYSMGPGDVLYDTIKEMSQIRQWKKIYSLNDAITNKIMFFKKTAASINEFKAFIGEDYFDNIYLDFDLGGISRIIMNTFKHAHLVTYGDQLGLLIDENSWDRFGGIEIGRNIFEALIIKVKSLARKIAFCGFSAPERFFDLAVLALPLDQTKFQYNIKIPLIIPEKKAILDIINQIHGQISDVKEYCLSFLKKDENNSCLILLCNFCELKMMSADNEIKMYEHMTHDYSPKGSSIILKPHPRTSSDFLTRLSLLLEKDYQVKIISDERFSRLPFEMWIPVIKNCKIINVFSSSELNIAYLYNKKIILNLKDGLIKKYFPRRVQKYILYHCHLVNEIINRMESWDGKSYLWIEGTD